MNDKTKNKFLTGLTISDLVHNLRVQPPERMHGALDGLEKERLAAIVHQAESLHDCTVMSLKAFGKLIAVASESGEAEQSEMINAGYLVEFLADLVEFFDSCASNARYSQEVRDA